MNMKNRMSNNHHRFVLCGFYLAVSAGFTNVTAQPAGSSAIEEIIVTAPRREQALDADDGYSERPA